MYNKTIKAGEVIFMQGDKSDAFYQIKNKDGQVSIIANYKKDDETEIATVSAGKFIGEMGLIENTKRSATAVAKTDVDLLVIEKASFSNYISNNPEDAIKIMKSISANLRATTRDYVEACKTIAEYVDENKDNNQNKKGIWAKLKKYADVYSESCYSQYESDFYSQQYLDPFRFYM